MALALLQHARNPDASASSSGSESVPLELRREVAAAVRDNLADRLARGALARPLETLCLLHYEPVSRIYTFRHEI